MLETNCGQHSYVSFLMSYKAYSSLPVARVKLFANSGSVGHLPLVLVPRSVMHRVELEISAKGISMPVILMYGSSGLFCG